MISVKILLEEVITVSIGDREIGYCEGDLCARVCWHTPGIMCRGILEKDVATFIGNENYMITTYCSQCGYKESCTYDHNCDPVQDD